MKNLSPMCCRCRGTQISSVRFNSERQLVGSDCGHCNNGREPKSCPGPQPKPKRERYDRDDR